MTTLPETRGRSLEQIETGFSSESSSKSKSTIVTEPKNVTLKNYTIKSEDKYSNIIANVYAYDNLCLNLTLDDIEKNHRSENNFGNDPRYEISCIAVEKIYVWIEKNASEKQIKTWKIKNVYFPIPFQGPKIFLGKKKILERKQWKFYL